MTGEGHTRQGTGSPVPPAARRRRPANSDHDTLIIALAGLCSGALYFLVYRAQRGIFLNGLDPVAVRYPVAALAHPAVGDLPDRGRLLGQCLIYYAGIIALFALYGHLLARCQRGRPRDPRARVALVLFPLLFNLGLLCGRPTLSQDALTYVAYGHVAATSGGNPQTGWASDALTGPVGEQLLALGWHPVYFSTPYGPVWTAVESAIMRVTGDVAVALVLFKALAVAGSLGAAGAIWAILGRIRPAGQLAGTIGYLWNPVVIIQFAAEGHNDAVMIALVLAALLWGIRRCPRASMALMALGILTKYVPLLLLPGQVIYLWRTRPAPVRLLRLAAGLALAAAVAVALYQPAWVGPAAFAGLRARITPGARASLPGVLFWILSHLLSPPRAALATSALLGSGFGVYLAASCRHLRNDETWLTACGGTVLFGILIVSPVYWPWYATLPIALLALTTSGQLRGAAFALSLGAGLIAPLDSIYANHFITWHASAAATMALGLAMPLLFWLAASARALWWQRQHVVRDPYCAAS